MFHVKHCKKFKGIVILIFSLKNKRYLLLVSLSANYSF